MTTLAIESRRMPKVAIDAEIRNVLGEMGTNIDDRVLILLNLMQDQQLMKHIPPHTLLEVFFSFLTEWHNNQNFRENATRFLDAGEKSNHHLGYVIFLIYQSLIQSNPKYTKKGPGRHSIQGKRSRPPVRITN